MRTKQCPGCKKHVKMDADKCKYCGYPFDLITKVKHEKIDEILEQFEKKCKERDKDSLLQYVGILQFLGYNQIDFLWSKINYIEGNCEEALKRLEYHSSKKKYTEEYIMHKFQCIALTGNIVAYLEYYNEVKKYFKNFWKVMTYYIECITNQTVEQDKKD